MGREVPILLYPRGQEGDIQLSVSLGGALWAWRDKGERPLTARLAIRSRPGMADLGRSLALPKSRCLSDA